MTLIPSDTDNSVPSDVPPGTAAPDETRSPAHSLSGLPEKQAITPDQIKITGQAGQIPGRMGMGVFLRRILVYTHPYAGITALLLPATLLNLAWPVFNPLIYRAIINQALLRGDGSLLIRLLVLLAVVMGLDFVGGLASGYLGARIGSEVAGDLRLAAVRHLQRLSPLYYSRVPAGDLLTCMTADVDTVETAMMQTLPKAARLCLQVVICLALLFVLDWPMAALSLLLVPVVYYIPRTLGPPAVRATDLRQADAGRVIRRTQETIGAHLVIKAFGLQTLMFERARDDAAALRQSSFQSAYLNGLLGTVTVVSSRAFQILLVGVGAGLIVRGWLSIGALYAFYLYLEYAVDALQGVFGLAPMLQQAVGALQRVEALLAEPSGIADKPGAVPLPVQARDIQFDGVSFSYDGSRRILSDVSLTIPAGSSVAIVGPSGSGKSTILNLLLRFYDPDRGTIAIDGHDLRDVTVESVQALCGVVFQESLLFDTTIRENIRLGKPMASDADVEEAARMAQIDNFVRSLPDGYNTAVGERGSRLSGGQRQRVALARALVRQPAMLLLDEATSALDPATEAAFNATLVDLARQRTVISITHRLTSVLHADRIFVLDQGRLIEQGSHGQLLARNGLYRTLWDHQAGVSISQGGRRATTNAAHLKNVPLFSRMPDHLLAELAGRFASEHFADGEVIITEGVPGDKFYILAHGTADVLRRTAAGREQRVEILGDADFFGEMALLWDVPRTATVRARTPCLVLGLSRDHFDDLLIGVPEVRATIEQVARAREQKGTGLVANA